MASAPRASAPDSTGTTSANQNGRRGLIDLARVAVEDTIRLVQQEIELAKTQLQTNRAVQVTIGALVLAVTGFAVFGYRARRRRSPAEQLVRKLKLNELRARLNDFRDDARAWASAQRRIVKADGKTKVEVQSKEGIARRLLISAAEAALTALAAGYARRLIGGASTPREREHAAVSKKR